MNDKHFFKEFVIYFFLIFIVNLLVTYLWNMISDGVGTIDWPRSIIFPIIWALALPLANAFIINKNKK
jgi:hypothetical protein